MRKDKIVKQIVCGNGVFDREVYETENSGNLSYTEVCIVCGSDTGVDIRTELSKRSNYVEGCGQTCGCHLNLK